MNQFFPPSPPNPYSQNKLYVKKGLSKPFTLIAGILSLVICAVNAYIVYSVSQIANDFTTIRTFLDGFYLSFDLINQAESTVENLRYAIEGFFGVVALCYLFLFLGFLISFISSLNKNSDSSPSVGIGFITAGAVIDIILKTAALILSILLLVFVLYAINQTNASSLEQAQVVLYISIGITVYAFFMLLFSCSIASFASSARKTLKEKGKFKNGIGLNSFCAVLLSLVDIAAGALLIMVTLKFNRPISDITMPLVILGGLLLFKLSICFAMLGYGAEISNLMGAMPVESPFQAPETPIPPEALEPTAVVPPVLATNYPESTFDPNTAAAQPVVSPNFDPEATVVLNEAPKNTETCPICGNENYIGSKFCEYCGNSIVKNEQPNNSVQNTAAQPVKLEKPEQPKTETAPDFDPEATVVLREPPKLTEICPVCGNENYIGSKFCEYCGNTIAKNEQPDNTTLETKPQPPVPVPPAQPETKPASDFDPEATVVLREPPKLTETCPVCGTENYIGSHFCEKCGTSFIQESKTQPENPTSNQIPASEPVMNPVSIKKPEPKTVMPEQLTAAQPVTVPEPMKQTVPAQPAVSTAPAAANPDEKLCPKCGTANAPASLFCKKCGVMLNNTKPKPAPAPAPKPVQLNTCSNCGTNNDPQSKFCKRCGNKLQ